MAFTQLISLPSRESRSYHKPIWEAQESKVRKHYRWTHKVWCDKQTSSNRQFIHLKISELSNMQLIRYLEQKASVHIFPLKKTSTALIHPTSQSLENTSLRHSLCLRKLNHWPTQPFCGHIHSQKKVTTVIQIKYYRFI